MFIGGRVAYVMGANARLGVLVGMTDNYSVLLDSGKITPVNPDRVHLVDFWKDVARDIPKEKLRLLPRDSDPLEMFKSQRGIIFGLQAMRACWLFANQHVFNSALTMPKFVTSTEKKNAGKYTLKRGEKVGTIMCSTRNHNMREVFATMLHEMVHQHNFEIDWRQKGEFNPSVEGTHGQAFMRWLPLIRQRTGITITVTVDVKQDTTVFVDPNDEANVKPFIFALINWRDTWFGFTLKDDFDLAMFTADARAILQANRTKDAQVYAGYSTLKRVQQEFLKVTGGKFNAKSMTKSIPAPPVVKLAVQTAKPIDGWSLPARLQIKE